jgi:hypothetical protein
MKKVARTLLAHGQQFPARQKRAENSLDRGLAS